MPLNKNNVELVFKSESAGPLYASVTYKMIHFKASGPVEENLVHRKVNQILMGFQKYTESWINALLHHRVGQVLRTPPVNVLILKGIYNGFHV
jgi:hypothetical protein